MDPDEEYKSKKNGGNGMNSYELSKLKQHGMIEKSKVKKYASMDYMGMGIERIVEEYEYLDNMYHEVVESGKYELSDNEATYYHKLEYACEELLGLIRDYADYLEHYE